MNEPVFMRNGNLAIPFAVLKCNDHSTNRIFGVYQSKIDGWRTTTWGLDGKYLLEEPSDTDLMLPKRRFWVVWPSDFARPAIFTDEFAAKKFAEFHEFPFSEYEEP